MSVDYQLLNLVVFISEDKYIHTLINYFYKEKKNPELVLF